jgi:hypothetical protein
MIPQLLIPPAAPTRPAGLAGLPPFIPPQPTEVAPTPTTVPQVNQPAAAPSNLASVINTQNAVNIGTLGWNSGIVIMGDLFDIYNLLSQYASPEEAISELPAGNYIQVGENNQSLMIRNVSQQGTKTVYSNLDTNGITQQIFIL